MSENRQQVRGVRGATGGGGRDARAGGRKRRRGEGAVHPAVESVVPFATHQGWSWIHNFPD